MLFEPVKLGALELTNRFIRSATFEGMADRDGLVTPELIELYGSLAKGKIGAIITGYMSVSREGRGAPDAIGIYSDEMIPGLRDLAKTLKANDSRAIFQIHHAGGQTMKRFSGFTPKAPSGSIRDPMFMCKPEPLSVEAIRQIVIDFAEAARRAQEAGADGVQIHAAHGYLLSEFLSPFFNRRTDEYGGSKENQYRILNEILSAIRRQVGEKFLVLVKMNHDDGTPQPGMTEELAAYYASLLRRSGVDGLELSAGSPTWAPFVMCRGDVEVDHYVRVFPWIIRPFMKRRFRAMEGQAPFQPAYNLRPAPSVKAALGDVPLALVGGLRTLDDMEEIVSSDDVDLISMSRPFVRQPNLIQLFESGKKQSALCDSCNRCLAAIFNGFPLRCYSKGLPRR